jgi:hypothetical protein
MFAEMDTPESKLKFEEDHRVLREVVYAGLRDFNTGFDSPQIGHFSPVDFLTVIGRCESLHVRVIGIEVFTTDVKPPCKVGFLEIEISSEDGYEWARRLAATDAEVAKSVLLIYPSGHPDSRLSPARNRLTLSSSESLKRSSLGSLVYFVIRCIKPNLFGKGAQRVGGEINQILANA